MPILHAIDVARVAHDTLTPLTGNAKWARQDPAVHDKWIRACERALLAEDSVDIVLMAIGEMHDQLAKEMWIALIVAIRPFAVED